MAMMRLLGIYPLEPHIRSEAKVVVLMKGVEGLADALRIGMKRAKKNSEQKAQRGVIQGDMVRIGSRSYPFKAAVDCNTEEGCLVWVQISKGGTAVIVGA